MSKQHCRLWKAIWFMFGISLMMGALLIPIALISFIVVIAGAAMMIAGPMMVEQRYFKKLDPAERLVQQIIWYQPSVDVLLDKLGPKIVRLMVEIAEAKRSEAVK